VIVANRFGSAAVRAPSIVTSMPVMGIADSFACISISVTPHDDTPPRNASLLVKASAWGRDEESRTSRYPRASLRARPRTPLLEDRTASIFMSLILIPPLRFCRATPRYITSCGVAQSVSLFPEGLGRPIAYDGF